MKQQQQNENTFIRNINMNNNIEITARTLLRKNNIYAYNSKITRTVTSSLKELK